MTSVANASRSCIRLQLNLGNIHLVRFPIDERLVDGVLVAAARKGFGPGSETGFPNGRLESASHRYHRLLTVGPSLFLDLAPPNVSRGTLVSPKSHSRPVRRLVTDGCHASHRLVTDGCHRFHGLVTDGSHRSHRLLTDGCHRLNRLLSEGGSFDELIRPLVDGSSLGHAYVCPSAAYSSTAQRGRTIFGSRRSPLARV